MITKTFASIGGIIKRRMSENFEFGNQTSLANSTVIKPKTHKPNPTFCVLCQEHPANSHTNLVTPQTKTTNAACTRNCAKKKNKIGGTMAKGR